MSVTRLAPSPTGALHIGNARTFLLTWLLARQRGWKVLLRIDDLDGPRVRRGADEEALADLRWLGLDWDGEIVRQSSRREVHRAAIDRLLQSGVAYPCTCTRSEVERAASAPHAEDGASVYPGTCRGRFADLRQARETYGREPAIRVLTDDRPVRFVDGIVGAREFRIASQLGDFVVAKGDGTPSYQLATVVDDAAEGVTHVVRGDDLLDSTPRQMLLYSLLGLDDAIPEYLHLPLIVGPDGRRLAKRHGDTRLASLRDRGVDPRRLLAMLARMSGVDCEDAVTLDELINDFSLAQLPRQRVTLTTELERQWLSAP